MDKFDKKITNKILPKFTNAKEWPDLMTILKNLKNNLNKYSTSNMGILTDRVTLSKRLAQCLNPSVPGGLHEMALEIYSMLYDNIKKYNNNLLGDNLGLYSSGLFPFFIYASAQNKIKFLENIIKKHYLTLEKCEFKLCLSGMLICILPGLEEQNETLQKTIKEIFKESRNILGDEYFYGILWSIIFKNSRLRIDCIKYINETIPIYKDLSENESEFEICKKNFFPNTSILVLNSLKVLIEDSDLQTQRISMDFIISHFPLNNNILEENDKINLLISGLKLLIKNDYSTTRRLLIWLLGAGQDDDFDISEPNTKYMIQLVIKSLKKMFNLYFENKQNEVLLNGIKIIDQLFKQQVKLVDYILEAVSIDLITVVEYYWDRSDKQLKDEVINRIKNFYNYDSGYLDCLWQSLGKKLDGVVNNNNNKELLNNEQKEEEDNKNDENKINNISNNEDDNLNSNENNKNFMVELESLNRIINFCLVFIKLEKPEKKIKFFIPIISSLLKSLQLYKITNSEDLKILDPIISLILKITKNLQLGIKDDISLFLPKNMNKLFLTQPIKFSSKNGNSLQYILKLNEQNTFLIELLAKNILVYYKTYINICKVLLECEILTRNEFKIFKNCTELSILIQEYILNDNNDIPEWIFYLEKIIFSYKIELALEGIFFLLDLFMVSSENSIYDNIKAYLRTEEISETLIDNELLKDLINQTHVSCNCIELSMARLWILIEDQNHQKPVTDLLIKFFLSEQNVFQNTISNTFAINDIEQNVNAIKKFSQFWKLTSEFYPDIIFFENGECIFKMLDFLDHEHPLLRHLSKSWLSEAKDQFHKIIDPLLKVLLDKDTTWYISFQKQLFFTKEYDNRRIIEAFRKLKNIIINAPEISIKYFVEKPITQTLIDMDELGRQIRSVSKSISLEHYLDLLVSISLRFIQGKFIESISQKFYRENFSVNAASCEFLEFLLSFIEPKKKVMNIAQIISEPVLNILQESLLTNDEVMQVQLINLLKVLLLSTKEEHLNFKEQSMYIFNNKKLLDCMIKGIQINYIFVRSYFINFVEMCLPVFGNILDKEMNLQIAKKLINTTTDFLVSRVKFNIIKKKSGSKINSMELDEGDKYFIVKNYLGEYKDFKILDENDINVIIKGLRNILYHFLSIENSNEKINWNEIKKELTSKNINSFSFFSFFKTKKDNTNNSNLNEENNNKNNNNKNIKNTNLSNSNLNSNTEKNTFNILDILQDVIASFCTCWINSNTNKSNKDFCLNEYGILSNPCEEFSFNEYNQLKINNTFYNQSKDVKNKIISILRNIFIKFPFEFIKNSIIFFQDENNRYISRDKQYKLSLIEIFEEIEIPLEIFLVCINKNIDSSKLICKKSKNKIKDNYPFILNKEQCIYESKLCHFVYSYINYYNEQNIKYDNKILIEIWNELINFINILIESKSSMTLFWLYEIINLSLYKFSIRDLTGDKNIKKNLSLIIINIYNKLVELSILNKFESCFEENMQIIVPLPPSIYEKIAINIYGENIIKIDNENENYNYLNLNFMQTEENLSFRKQSDTSDINNKINNEQNKNNKENTINNFYLSLHDYILNGIPIKTEEFLIINRNISFIILKNLFYSTMKNIFKQEKMITYFSTLIKQLLNIMGDHTNNDNKIYIDISTEFLHDLIQNASSIICGPCKQILMDFYLEGNFFNMNLHNLRLWKDIIQEFSHSYPNILNDLIDRLNQSGGFFSKISDDFNNIVMRRLSFIIYSCQKDTFSQKLGMILEKLKEMITKYSDNTNLESEIFLMLRIMFLRFSKENLNEMIKALWPIIFSEIVNVINGKRKNNSIELNLSSLKLIELLSVTNMDEFCLYNWIFFIDTYKINDLNIEDEESELNLLINNKNSNAFKPFAMGLSKNWEKCKDLIEKYKEKKFKEFEKRSLMIQVQKIINEDELAGLISRVFVYVGIMNNFRNIIDLDIVEEVIEKDFLT